MMEMYFNMNQILYPVDGKEYALRDLASHRKNLINSLTAAPRFKSLSSLGKSPIFSVVEATLLSSEFS
jgi:hypothetical protein